MTGDTNASPQLPPRPLAEEEGPEPRLPWFICGLTAGSMLVGSWASSAVMLGVLYAMGNAPVPGNVPWVSWFVGPGVWLVAGRGLALGLGAAIGDRVGPERWSRPLRWGVGMGVAYLLSRPDYPYHFIVAFAGGTLSGWTVLDAWLILSGPLTYGLMGAWFARLASCGSVGWGRLALIGASVEVAFLVPSLIIQVAHRGLGAFPSALFPYAWLVLAGNGLARALVGALLGLSFWIALTLADRRARS